MTNDDRLYELTLERAELQKSLAYWERQADSQARGFNLELNTHTIARHIEWYTQKLAKIEAQLFS